MIELPTQDVLRALLEYNPETGLFIWKERGVSSWDNRWAGKPALCCNWNGYKVGVILCKRSVQAHRVAFKYMHGHDPVGQIDHINGIRFDNRIANLRDVTVLENRRNAACPSHNTSGFIGVRFRPDRNRWRAHISVNNNTKHLGSFSTREEAIAARKAAEAFYGFHENHGRPMCR